MIFFKVGDLIIGNELNLYAQTRKGVICEVIDPTSKPYKNMHLDKDRSTDPENLISVIIVSEANNKVYMVNYKLFDLYKRKIVKKNIEI
jgi:hypothetical protein